MCASRIEKNCVRLFCSCSVIFLSNFKHLKSCVFTMQYAWKIQSITRGWSRWKMPCALWWNFLKYIISFRNMRCQRFKQTSGGTRYINHVARGNIQIAGVVKKQKRVKLLEFEVVTACGNHSPRLSFLDHIEIYILFTIILKPGGSQWALLSRTFCVKTNHNRLRKEKYFLVLVLNRVPGKPDVSLLVGCFSAMS